MAQSTVSAGTGKGSSEKPKKPRPDFPLFPHSGRWAKKIRGKRYYFGKWDDPEAALNKYLDQKDDLYAGRTPRKAPGEVTVRYLCDAFYDAKVKRLKGGEISPRTVQEYDSTCERIVRVFGRNRSVENLGPDDFEKLREDIASTRGPVALVNEIQRCRTVFKWAHRQRLILDPVHYGESFDKPKQKTIRAARTERVKAHGQRMLEAHEIRAAIYASGPVMRAMILLAINGGLGQSDLSGLPLQFLDLDGGWIDYPRPKTQVPRRVPLWDETVDAIRAALDVRPTPKNEVDTDLVFLTRCGQRWVKTNAKGTPADALGQEFAKLLTELKLKRPGVSFYALRHSFRTIADETRDFPAVDFIMGHTDVTMAKHYRERFNNDRLRAVVDYVHAWLFPRPTVG